jgi:hypothetical protein
VLQQIAGLGTLVGAAFPAGGQGVGNKIIGALEKIFGGVNSSGTYTPSEGDNMLSDLADFGG